MTSGVSTRGGARICCRSGLSPPLVSTLPRIPSERSYKYLSFYCTIHINQTAIHSFIRLISWETQNNSSSTLNKQQLRTVIHRESFHYREFWRLWKGLSRQVSILLKDLIGWPNLHYSYQSNQKSKDFIIM
jgi:hypothetical protein